MKQHDERGGVILQRHLDETTSYAESVADTQGADFTSESIRSPTVASIDQFATRDEKDHIVQSSNRPAARMEIDGKQMKPDVSNYDRLTISTSSGNRHQLSERDLFWNHSLPQGQHNDLTTTQTIREQNSSQGNDSQEAGLPTDGPVGNKQPAKKKHSLTRTTKLLDSTAISESQNARQRLCFWNRRRLNKKLDDIVRDTQYHRYRFSSPSPARGCSGGLQEIEDLLNQGADVNFPRSTPGVQERRDILDEEFYHNGRPDVVELLLSRGATSHMTQRAFKHDCLARNANENGESITHLLKIVQCYESDMVAVEMFYEDALYNAAIKGQRGAVLKLLQRGVKVNARKHVRLYKDVSINRNTALIGACFSNQIAVVKLLLKHGANINAKPSTAQATISTTALIATSTDGSSALVELLLEHGAETDPVAANGRVLVETTALLSACRAGKVEVIRLLLTNGANIRALDVENRDAVDTTLDAWTTRPCRFPSRSWDEERYRIVAEYLPKCLCDDSRTVE